MKAVKKSPFRLLDVIFVGWSLITYDKLGHWSRTYAVLMISLTASVDTLLIRAIVDTSKASEESIWLTMVVVNILSGAALYYVYLRDKKYAHALVEIYRSDRRMAWYARIVAIAFYSSPAPIGAIHLLVNGT